MRINKFTSLPYIILSVITCCLMSFPVSAIDVFSGSCGGGSGSTTPAGGSTTPAGGTGTGTGTGTGAGTGAGSTTAGSTTSGQSICGATTGDSFQNLMKNIINTMLVVLGMIAVVMIVIGGIRYTTSNGDAAQIKSAKDTIMYAVIGIVVAIMAYAIVNFVLASVGGKS